MFALVLRMAGTQPPTQDMPLASDASPIDDMCEVTGGRSFCVSSHRLLVQSLEALVAKVQGGVVINFERAPEDVWEPSWQSCRRLIYVQRSAQKGYSVGHWPLPEAFWPDLNSPSLPPRSAHPQVCSVPFNPPFFLAQGPISFHSDALARKMSALSYNDR